MGIMNKLESTSVTINRSITFSKNDTPLYIIEVEGNRCSDASLPIKSIKTKAVFYNDIINFVKKYGNADDPYNYFNRFYLTNLKTGKRYAFIMNDTAYYGRNRYYSSIDYLRVYLGESEEKWDEFSKQLETATVPFEGIVYHGDYTDDFTAIVRDKHSWKFDRHLLFVPYGEIEFRPRKFHRILMSNLEGAIIENDIDV